MSPISLQKDSNFASGYFCGQVVPLKCRYYCMSSYSSELVFLLLHVIVANDFIELGGF